MITLLLKNFICGMGNLGKVFQNDPFGTGFETYVAISKHNA
jgi:hypothetical protein